MCLKDIGRKLKKTGEIKVIQPENSTWKVFPYMLNQMLKHLVLYLYFYFEWCISTNFRYFKKQYYYASNFQIEKAESFQS